MHAYLGQHASVYALSSLQAAAPAGRPATAGLPPPASCTPPPLRLGPNSSGNGSWPGAAVFLNEAVLQVGQGASR